MLKGKNAEGGTGGQESQNLNMSRLISYEGITGRALTNDTSVWRSRTIRMNLRQTGWLTWLVESVDGCSLIKITDIKIGNRCSGTNILNFKTDTAAPWSVNDVSTGKDAESPCFGVYIGHHSLESAILLLLNKPKCVDMA